MSVVIFMSSPKGSTEKEFSALFNAVLEPKFFKSGEELSAYLAEHNMGHGDIEPKYNTCELFRIEPLTDIGRIGIADPSRPRRL